MSGAGRQTEQSIDPVGSERGVLRACAMGCLAAFVVLVISLLLADLAYLHHWHVTPLRLWRILASDELLACLKLSVVTSLVTLILVLLTSIPVGYALSRYRFMGHSVLNTVIDVPIVLPPVVIGLSLLAFFGTPFGGALKAVLENAHISLVSGVGIVLCQYFVSVSYCIRSTKASFDDVDRRLEKVAQTLGCSEWQAFRRVSLPLARNGLIAGGVMAWARAIGVFGPLMVFVGTGPRVQVMPTNMWLELNVGNIEAALVVALIATALAGIALLCVHRLCPGRTWT